MKNETFWDTRTLLFWPVRDPYFIGRCAKILGIAKRGVVEAVPGFLVDFSFNSFESNSADGVSIH